MTGNFDKLLYAMDDNGGYYFASRYNGGSLSYGQYWLYVDSSGAVHKRKYNATTPLNDPGGSSNAYLCIDSNKKVCKYDGVPKTEYKWTISDSGSILYYDVNDVIWYNYSFSTVKYTGRIYFSNYATGTKQITNNMGYTETVTYLMIYYWDYYIEDTDHPGYANSNQPGWGDLYARYDDVSLGYRDKIKWLSCEQQT